MLWRKQLNHDNLMPDQIIPRLQVLRNAHRPAFIRKVELVPGEAIREVAFRAHAIPVVGAAVEAAFVDLKPDFLIRGIEVFAGPVAGCHVDQQRALAVHPRVLRALALEWREGLVVAVDRGVGRLVHVGWTLGWHVDGGHVGAGFDGRVQCWVVCGERIAAVA